MIILKHKSLRLTRQGRDFIVRLVADAKALDE